jgi:hypothetical protein
MTQPGSQVVGSSSADPIPVFEQSPSRRAPLGTGGSSTPYMRPPGLRHCSAPRRPPRPRPAAIAVSSMRPAAPRRSAGQRDVGTACPQRSGQFARCGADGLDDRTGIMLARLADDGQGGNCRAVRSVDGDSDGEVLSCPHPFADGDSAPPDAGEDPAGAGAWRGPPR